LEDPRIIHPSPEEIFFDPAESPGDVPMPEPDAMPTREEDAPDDEGRGMIDPRNDSIGPDL